MPNLRADVFLPLSEGHLMWTDARLASQAGLLVAKTTTESVTLLGGFHGAVVVSLLDDKDQVIATSDQHTFGVDGRWIGKSRREDVWTHQFAPADAARAVRLGVAHTWNPDWLSGIRNTVYFVGQLWPILVDLFAGSGNGRTEAGGADNGSWGDAGEPWTTYQALASGPVTPDWVDIGPAPDVTAMTVLNGNLIAATASNALYSRLPVAGEVGWGDFGPANDVVGLASIGWLLFCADRHNALWAKIPSLPGASWARIGHANNVAGMTATDGTLYCATADNRLWSRPPELSEINWSHIGHANGVLALASTPGRLICATRDGKLWTRPTTHHDVDWTAVDALADVRAIAATNTHVFAATTTGRLFARPQL